MFIQIVIIWTIIILVIALIVSKIAYSHDTKILAKTPGKQKRTINKRNIHKTKPKRKIPMFQFMTNAPLFSPKDAHLFTLKNIVTNRYNQSEVLKYNYINRGIEFIDPNVPNDKPVSYSFFLLCNRFLNKLVNEPHYEQITLTESLQTPNKITTTISQIEAEMTYQFQKDSSSLINPIEAFLTLMVQNIKNKIMKINKSNKHDKTVVEEICFIFMNIFNTQNMNIRDLLCYFTDIGIYVLPITKMNIDEHHPTKQSLVLWIDICNLFARSTNLRKKEFITFDDLIALFDPSSDICINLKLQWQLLDAWIDYKPVFHQDKNKGYSLAMSQYTKRYDQITYFNKLNPVQKKV